MQTLEMSEEEAAKKAKRALNRFNGMSVAEVMAKTLPDVITYNLDILIVSYLMLMHVFLYKLYRKSGGGEQEALVLCAPMHTSGRGPVYRIC